MKGSAIEVNDLRSKEVKGSLVVMDALCDIFFTVQYQHDLCDLRPRDCHALILIYESPLKRIYILLMYFCSFYCVCRVVFIGTHTSRTVL